MGTLAVMLTTQDRRRLTRWRFAVLLWLLAGLVVVLSVFGSGLLGLVAAMTAYGLGKYGAPWDWRRPDR